MDGIEVLKLDNAELHRYVMSLLLAQRGFEQVTSPRYPGRPPSIEYVQSNLILTCLGSLSNHLLDLVADMTALPVDINEGVDSRLAKTNILRIPVASGSHTPQSHVCFSEERNPIPFDCDGLRP